MADCCSCNCAKKTEQKLDYHFIEGYLATAMGELPIVSTELTAVDKFGDFLARVSSRRQTHNLLPGLYGVGFTKSSTDFEEAPVFVTGNYLNSFNALRSALAGFAAWILVLDTKGINVWCAAGKGTFSTEELIRSIEHTGLAQVVSHKNLILPQLGAPGVAGHLVKTATNFSLRYGPVRAEDLPKFIADGNVASREMRTVGFPLKERIILIPLETTAALKLLTLISLLWFALFFITEGITAWSSFRPIFYGLVTSLFTGCILTPILLPYIPFHSFWLKGFFLGLVGAIIVHQLSFSCQTSDVWLQILYWNLTPALAAWFALQFTGATPITSISGVRQEMKLALSVLSKLLFFSMAAFIINRVLLLMGN